jgi:SAM-dependent methyltransferase
MLLWTWAPAAATPPSPSWNRACKVIAIEEDRGQIKKLEEQVAGKPYEANLYVLKPQQLEATTPEKIADAMEKLREDKSRKADAILAAASLHWLKRDEALSIFRNDILKPDGKLIGISYLIDPEDAAVQELHEILRPSGYETKETHFGKGRWSNVEIQAARYMEDGFTKDVSPEPRTFKSFDEFKGYLGTVSSLIQWIKEMPEDSDHMRNLKAFYDKHAIDGELTLPWKYIACIGSVQQETKTDPHPPITEQNLREPEQAEKDWKRDRLAKMDSNVLSRLRSVAQRYRNQGKQPALLSIGEGSGADAQRIYVEQLNARVTATDATDVMTKFSEPPYFLLFQR